MVDSYTLGMNPVLTVPLFDSGTQPASWNERMLPGEYAVHYSNFDSSALVAGPSCTILGSLADAEEYAKAQVILKPELRCRIYDDQGFVGPPILEVRGQQYKGESDISPRFRRWCGSLLFFGGLALVIADWSADFKLTWPATIGVRMLSRDSPTILWNDSRGSRHITRMPPRARLIAEVAGRVPERRNLLFDQGDQGAGGTVARPGLGLFRC